MPGIAASTSETWLFGSPPNSVDAPEKSFEFEVTWAWISMPMTTSQSPVAPLMSFAGLTDTFISGFYPDPERRKTPETPSRDANSGELIGSDRTEQRFRC